MRERERDREREREPFLEKEIFCSLFVCFVLRNKRCVNYENST